MSTDCRAKTFTLEDSSDTTTLDHWLRPLGWQVDPSPAKAWPDQVRLRPTEGDHHELVGGLYMRSGETVQWDGETIVRQQPAISPQVRPLVDELLRHWAVDHGNSAHSE